MKSTTGVESPAQFVSMRRMKGRQNSPAKPVRSSPLIFSHTPSEKESKVEQSQQFVRPAVPRKYSSLEKVENPVEDSESKGSGRVTPNPTFTNVRLLVHHLSTPGVAGPLGDVNREDSVMSEGGQTELRDDIEDKEPVVNQEEPETISPALFTPNAVTEVEDASEKTMESAVVKPLPMKRTFPPNKNYAEAAIKIDASASDSPAIVRVPKISVSALAARFSNSSTGEESALTPVKPSVAPKPKSGRKFGKSASFPNQSFKGKDGKGNQDAVCEEPVQSEGSRTASKSISLATVCSAENGSRGDGCAAADEVKDSSPKKVAKVGDLIKSFQHSHRDLELDSSSNTSFGPGKLEESTNALYICSVDTQRNKADVSASEAIDLKAEEPVKQDCLHDITEKKETTEADSKGLNDKMSEEEEEKYSESIVLGGIKLSPTNSISSISKIRTSPPKSSSSVNTSPSFRLENEPSVNHSISPFALDISSISHQNSSTPARSEKTSSPFKRPTAPERKTPVPPEVSNLRSRRTKSTHVIGQGDDEQHVDDSTPREERLYKSLSSAGVLETSVQDPNANNCEEIMELIKKEEMMRQGAESLAQRYSKESLTGKRLQTQLKDSEKRLELLQEELNASMSEAAPIKSKVLETCVKSSKRAHVPLSDIFGQPKPKTEKYVSPAEKLANYTPCQAQLTVHSIKIALFSGLGNGQASKTKAKFLEQYYCIVKDRRTSYRSQYLDVDDDMTSLTFKDEFSFNVDHKFTVLFEIYRKCIKRKDLKASKLRSLKKIASFNDFPVKEKETEVEFMGSYELTCKDFKDYSTQVLEVGNANGVSALSNTKEIDCRLKKVKLNPKALQGNMVINSSLMLKRPNEVLKEGFVNIQRQGDVITPWHHVYYNIYGLKLMVWKNMRMKHDPKETFLELDLRDCNFESVRALNRIECFQPHTFLMTFKRPQETYHISAVSRKELHELLDTLYKVLMDISFWNASPVQQQ